jgi:hypothetical protein
VTGCIVVEEIPKNVPNITNIKYLQIVVETFPITCNGIFHVETGLESGLDWTGIWTGLNLDWTGLESGLDCTGLESGLDWNFDWTGI